MPILGYDLQKKSKGFVKEHDFNVIEYYHPMLIVGINSPREIFKDETVHRRRPGALHHLAFRAESKVEVDDAYFKIREIGANIIDLAKYYPQHGESYYALFF